MSENDAERKRVKEEYIRLRMEEEGFTDERDDVKREYQQLVKERDNTVIQEMHPDFEESDRFLLKNLAKDKPKQLAELKKRYPHLNIKMKDGQIVAKKEDEFGWKVFDEDKPLTELSTYTSAAKDPMGALKEALLDVGDVAWDVGAGAATTGAGAAAGVSAAAPSGGTMSLPAATLAAGTTSGALEALRQKLGQQFGIEQEVDPVDVGIAGVAGGAGSLLFGSGGNVMKAPARKGLGKIMDVIDAPARIGSKVGAKAGTKALGGREALQKTQSGLIGKALDTQPAKATGAWIAGLSEDVVDAVQNQRVNLEKMLSQAKSGGTPAINRMAKISQKQKAAFAREKAKHAAIEARGEQALKASGKTFDVSKHVDRIDSEIEKALKNDDRRYLEELRGLKKDFFTESKESAEGLLEPDVFDEYTLGSSLIPVEGTKAIPKTIIEADAALTMHQRLKNVGRVDRMDHQKFSGGANKLYSGGETTDFIRLTNDINKEIRGDLDKALKGLGKAEDGVDIGQAAIQARADLGNVINMQKGFEKMVGASDARAYETFRKAQQTMKSEELKRVDKLVNRAPGDVKLDEEMKLLAAFERYSPSPEVPKSLGSWASVPAAVIGGGVGGLAGYGLGLRNQAGQDGEAGGAITTMSAGGAALGLVLGGPANMRRMINSTTTARGLQRMLGPLVRGPEDHLIRVPTKGVYDMMTEKEER